MIKTLKKKVIVTAMIAITILLVVLLGAVNIVNAWSYHQETEALLDDLSRLEASGNRPEWMRNDDAGGPPPLPEGETRDWTGDSGPIPPEGGMIEPADNGKGRGFMAEPLTENDWRAAVYFTVRVKNGSIVSVDISRISSVSEDEARAYGEKALSKGSSGSLDSFRYTSAAAQDGTSVFVFLENSSRRNAVLRVAALSALAGLAGWGLMLLLVILLSKKAVAPIAANMDRQRQFVTDAGHELKTPLSIIKANTEAMELLSGPTKWSRNISEQVDRLSDLTRNLLTLARAEDVPTEGSLSEVDLSALAEKTAGMFREPMTLQKVRFTQAIQPGLLVRGSASQLSTLCSILLDNAVKYTPEEGRIDLTLKQQDKVLLRVENDCEQVPACKPEQLFDRFYRGDAARTQSSGGFGIGLSAAQVIAKQNKGKLEAEYLGDKRIAFTVTFLPV